MIAQNPPTSFYPIIIIIMALAGLYLRQWAHSIHLYPFAIKLELYSKGWILVS